jgi:hypothetical protein
MKTIKTLHASVPHTLFLVVSVGMVAFLLLGAFMMARPVQAAVNAICTTTADGDWTDAIWDCGTVPGATDDAVILHEVTIHTDQAVHSLSINVDSDNELFGSLVFTEPATLTINGDFTKDAAGIFDPGNDWFESETGGTVVFGPGENTITTHGEVVDFYNLTKVASGADEKISVDPQVAGSGGIHIWKSLTLQGVDGGTFLSLGSTTPGSKWGIWPEDTAAVNYVDVQDSNNVGFDTLNVAVGNNAGNNTGWIFGGLSVGLDTSGSPNIAGHVVTFTATISPSDATGTVNFTKDGSTIHDCGTQPVVNGVATCETESLVTSGDHTITAVFNGSGLYAGQTATADPLTQVVTSLSAVALNVTPSPIVFGDSVTLTAKISPLSATSGEVSFMLDSQEIADCESQSISLVGGVPTATCEVNSLALGSHSFGAAYQSGSPFFGGSTSTTIVKVVKYASTVGISSSKNPSVVGTPVILTASVSTLSPSAGGSVSFKSGGVTIAGCGSVTVVSGIAQCMVNPPVGSYNITVEYGGDDATFGSSSSIMPQVVNIAKYYLPRVGN